MIRALVAVYSCDLCGQYESVNTLNDDDVQNFADNWLKLEVKTFCKDCKSSGEAARWQGLERYLLRTEV